MLGQWIFAFSALVLLFGAFWLLGTLQTAVPSRPNASLLGVLMLLGLCIFSAREILGQFLDLGAFGS